MRQRVVSDWGIQTGQFAALEANFVLKFYQFLAFILGSKFPLFPKVKLLFGAVVQYDYKVRYDQFPTQGHHLQRQQPPLSSPPTTVSPPPLISPVA